MSISAKLVSEFVKITNDSKQKDTAKQTITYGTVDSINGEEVLVHLDGAAQGSKLPASTTVTVRAKDRVIVMIKNHSAVITGNMGTKSAGESYVDDDDTIRDLVEVVKETKKTVVEHDTVIADKIDVDDLKAEIGDFETLLADTTITAAIVANMGSINELAADNVTIKDGLEAAEGRIGDLEVDNVTIKDGLEAAEGRIGDLEADNVTIKDGLEAAEGRIGTLETDVGDINTLIFGSATGETIQTEFANAVVAQVGTAQIKLSQIEDLTVENLLAGNISTNEVDIKSDNGRLLIADETIQISDGTRVRVQIGEDNSGDYSINIWDTSGNLMFSQGGITADAIKSAIIRDDMVSDNANINAKKLDIASLFTVINEDNSKTISSTKISVDTEAGTLDAELLKLAYQEDLDELTETVTSQGVQISANAEAISTKVWQQDIETAKAEIDKTTTALSTQYSELEQTVSGFQSTVSETYATKTENDAVDERVNVHTSLIEQLSDSISMLVTDINGASLMTQTESGWTFSTGDIQSLVNKTSEDLAALTDSLGSTDHAVSVLEQAVGDLGELAEYIKITTYEDEPCIELGESDSDFKLRITNTQMIFTEGSNVLAYFNNQALHIKKAVVEEELQQGEYAWVTRSNGHLSLIWKGGSS